MTVSDAHLSIGEIHWFAGALGDGYFAAQQNVRTMAADVNAGLADFFLLQVDDVQSRRRTAFLLWNLRQSWENDDYSDGGVFFDLYGDAWRAVVQGTEHVINWWPPTPDWDIVWERSPHLAFRGRLALDVFGGGTHAETDRAMLVLREARFLRFLADQELHR